MRKCIPSAAELLLKNYIKLAQEFTDAATPQVSLTTAAWAINQLWTAVRGS
jgi:hypothetical protein